MTLVFIDGAQGYNTAQATRKWGAFAAAVNATSGRRGGPGIRASNWSNSVTATKPAVGNTSSFTGNATWIMGFAFKVAALPSATRTLLLLYNATVAEQVIIKLTATGTLAAYRGPLGGTLLGTSTAVLTAGVYAYLEVKVLISDTVGTVEIRKDGISILTLTGLDTQNGAGGTIASFGFLGPDSEAATIDIDDVYACNGAGAAPQNNFLGDCRVDTTFPNAAGNLSQWTPSAGSNWQNVDEDPADDDVTYNFASVAATRDLYALPDIAPTTGTVFGVAVNMQVRKDDAAARTFRDLVRSGSTNFPGGLTHTAAATYNMFTEVHETDPNTSAAWTIANINLAEFGIDLVS